MSKGHGGECHYSVARRAAIRARCSTRVSRCSTYETRSAWPDAAHIGGTFNRADPLTNIRAVAKVKRACPLRGTWDGLDLGPAAGQRGRADRGCEDHRGHESDIAITDGGVAGAANLGVAARDSLATTCWPGIGGNPRRASDHRPARRSRLLWGRGDPRRRLGA